MKTDTESLCYLEKCLALVCAVNKSRALRDQVITTLVRSEGYCVRRDCGRLRSCCLCVARTGAPEKR